MKKRSKLFVLAVALVFLAGCSIGSFYKKNSENAKNLGAQKYPTSTNQVAEENANFIPPAVSTTTASATASTTLDQAIAALNGQHLKDLYRELAASSSAIDWGKIAVFFGEDEEKVHSEMNASSSDIDWHVIGSMLLATSSIDCESAAKAVYPQFDSEHYVAAAPLVSVADDKDDFVDNISVSPWRSKNMKNAGWNIFRVRKK